MKIPCLVRGAILAAPPLWVAEGLLPLPSSSPYRTRMYTAPSMTLSVRRPLVCLQTGIACLIVHSCVILSMWTSHWNLRALIHFTRSKRFPSVDSSLMVLPVMTLTMLALAPFRAARTSCRQPSRFRSIRQDATYDGLIEPHSQVLM